MGNKKTMNQLFGKPLVKQSKPDNFWPLPTELIGIEIETENFRNSTDAAYALQRWWTTHGDASLRNGVEWVLSAPMAGSDLREAIDAFFKGKYTYDSSERTSIHVHINASDSLSVDQFRNIFVLMYLIEPAVFRWADENRKWCGYCQPLTDMTPQRLAGVLLDDDSSSAFVSAVSGEGNSDRYYGLNVAAFRRHGTLEFRYFPCVEDGSLVVDWVKFVMQVKRAAMQADNPLEILAHFDEHENIEKYLTKWFDDNAPVIQRGLDYSDVVKRSVEMQALLTGTLSNVLNTMNYRGGNATTRGMQKLLTKRFGVAGTSTTATRRRPAVDEATRQQNAADLWQSLRQYNMGSSEVERVYQALNANLTSTR